MHRLTAVLPNTPRLDTPVRYPVSSEHVLLLSGGSLSLSDGSLLVLPRPETCQQNKGTYLMMMDSLLLLLINVTAAIQIRANKKQQEPQPWMKATWLLASSNEQT
jgi:hypothetical protein